MRNYIFKPCPFCGSKRIINWANYKKDINMIQCEECCSSTGAYEKEKDSIEAWNKRTTE